MALRYFAGVPGFEEFDEFGVFQELDFFVETQAFGSCVFQDRQVQFYDGVPQNLRNVWLI